MPASILVNLKRKAGFFLPNNEMTKKEKLYQVTTPEFQMNFCIQENTQWLKLAAFGFLRNMFDILEW